MKLGAELGLRFRRSGAQRRRSLVVGTYGGGSFVYEEPWLSRGVRFVRSVWCLVIGRCLFVCVVCACVDRARVRVGQGVHLYLSVINWSFKDYRIGREVQKVWCARAYLGAPTTILERSRQRPAPRDPCEASLSSLPRTPRYFLARRKCLGEACL